MGYFFFEFVGVHRLFTVRYLRVAIILRAFVSLLVEDKVSGLLVMMVVLVHLLVADRRAEFLALDNSLVVLA